MPGSIDVQIASDRPRLPTPQQIRCWARAALSGRREGATLTVRIVDDAEARELNRHWRGADCATNVLSFGTEGLEQIMPELLGDVVICAVVVEREATEQGKIPLAHWAHMVIHGVLHLLGFDHAVRGDARRMEGLERTILEELGFADPYEFADRT